jgi:hypothetical protein
LILEKLAVTPHATSRCAVVTAAILFSFQIGNPAVRVQDDDIAGAVEARRGKTELSKLAAQMKPGVWAELKTEMPKGLWSSPMVDQRGGLHIAGWTDDAHWDSRTGQLLYMGMRQTRQFIAYSEEKNAWRIVPLAHPPLRHARRGVYSRVWRDDVGRHQHGVAVQA